MSDGSWRPESLLAVSRRVRDGVQRFDPSVREFLDTFYDHEDGRVAALADRPVALDDVRDAYLAAVAEHLAAMYRFAAPAWCEEHGRPLRVPFFAGGLESLKAILTVESPAAFRRRLLFVSHDALDRPRRVRPGAS